MKILILKYLCIALAFGSVFFVSNIYTAQNSYAASCCNACLRCNLPGREYFTSCAKQGCECQSNKETEIDIKQITDMFVEHREWFIKTVWEAHTLPAMMLMTEQITATAIQQAMIIGTLFDAKHQLETQRILQSMQSDTHATYTVSEGMCQFGTMTRSLASTERKKDITQFALAARSSQRQLLNGDGISGGGPADDLRSRFDQYKNVYCQGSELSGGIDEICDAPNHTRAFKDVNFTAMAQNENLDLDFTTATSTDDETDVMALQANIYGHKIMPRIPEQKLSNEDGGINIEGVYTYMQMRALLAKRSIAQASFAAYVAERTQSNASVQPYMQAVLEEMGITAVEAQDIIGLRPSYYTQMKFLNNTIYQSPDFYADLYTTPENVGRKIVSMQALTLKSRLDAYDSMLRKNVNLSALLETYLDQYEDKVVNEIKKLDPSSEVIELPGL